MTLGSWGLTYPFLNRFLLSGAGHWLGTSCCNSYGSCCLGALKIKYKEQEGKEETVKIKTVYLERK